MANTKTGALIVIAGTENLKDYADTGERLDANVSARLIENIFFKNSPLHDGALIIRDGKIRVSGNLKRDERVEVKKAMLDKYPNLRGMYDENDANTELLYFESGTATISSFTDKPIVIKL